MSVKSMHTALMEMAQNQLDERMNAPIVHDGAKRAKDDLASAASNLNSAAKNASTGKKGLQKAKKEVGTAQSTLKGTKLESVERAAWVPESIADEQVEAFMEATVAAIAEGADTFVFEGKNYKAKKKSEAKLDPVGQADADIDNDGDVDSSDKYLHKRRKAIKKSMKNDDDEDKKEIDEEEKKGLWYNIHKKRKEGRPMRKPGSKGAPTDQDFKDAQKTSKKESVKEATAQTGKDAATTDTFQKQMGGGRSPNEKSFVDIHKMEVELDAEKINDENKANIEKALKQTPARMGDNLKNGDTSFVSPLKADIIDGITKALQQMKTNN